MKKLFKLAGLAVFLLLSGCFTLGTYRLPEAPPVRSLQPCGPTDGNQDTALRWQMNYLGRGAPLATGRSLWGTITRHVYPYTAHSDLFEMHLENTGTETLWLDPAQVRVMTSNESIPLYEASFFARAWPVGAVGSAEELLDRSLAQSEIFRTLLVARPLLPGEKLKAILPFPRQGVPPQQVQIQGWKWGEKALHVAFCLS
ncbi:MAG: hypothetical protein ACO1RX_02765 [Candidatus Sericytochromatia bacterium]